ncbi:hypothetical protein BGZ79_004089 [Entomortierella chlamydospora]|nr:hypothetical protein BGZ79_004089 [Entomortierella chlamydospora]
MIKLPLSQKFRSPANGEIISIEVQEDRHSGCAADKFVLWRHIQSSFGHNVRALRVNNVDIHCVVDSNFEDIIPLRIKYFPGVIIDVVHGERKDGNDENDGNDGKKSSLVNPPAYSPDLDDNYIGFGSKICLQHFKTGGLLRATDLRYKSFSFQHVVYSTRSRESILDDLWEVVAPKNAKGINEHLKNGLAYGSRIRLFNVSYKRWLHSHMIGAPVTANHREVTGYGSAEKSDSNDHWIVERVEEGTDLWKNSDVFILRHEASDYYLHSHATLFSGEIEASVAKAIEEPAPKPLEKPVPKPIEKPVTRPVEKPAPKPVEKPTAKPAEKPVPKPIEKPVTKPIEEPVPKPIKKLVVRPVEKPAPKPVEEPAPKPVEKPEPKPVEKPVAKPIEEPVPKPIENLYRNLQRTCTETYREPVPKPIENL